MNDRNAHLIGSANAQPWPTPPEYISPWTIERLKAQVDAMTPDSCCEGLVRLLLEVAHEADLKLAKAQYDIWTLEGLLKKE